MPVDNGKVSRHRLDDPVKSWLRASWSVAAQIDARKQYLEKLKKEREQPHKVIKRVTPSHQDLLKIGGFLYDGLVKDDPEKEAKCSKSDFIFGWAGFMDLVAQIDLEARQRAVDAQQEQENPAPNATE
jgi:hypothetical protein